MKKLMIAAAIVCAATMSQAVAFKWQSSDEGMAIAVDSIKGKGNGAYSVGSTSMDGVGTFTYVLSVYAAGTYGTESQTLIGSTSGDVSINASGKYTFGGNKDVDGTVVNTTYDYVLAITGSQSNILGLGDKVAATDGQDGTYDYTAAQLAWTTTGSIKTKSSGATQLTDLPTSFQVTGIGFTENVPEPTSGLLLLLGVAGLALRRRRA